MTKPDWAERLQRTRKREYDRGVIAERERIIKLINDRKELIRDADGLITAMRIPVDKEVAIAITEAIIYAIKENENE